jgi:acyl CoA:acetate/3-ketoacid CoA transferase beta subunit
MEFFDGAVVNLGIGIPTLLFSFVPEGIEVTYILKMAPGVWPCRDRRR